MGASANHFLHYLCKAKIEFMYYSGQEIVDIAVRIEENGNEFYTAAAGVIGEQTDTKGLFLDLAEKEVMHIAIFQKLAEKFNAESFDFQAEDASDYINHLAESHIFWQTRFGKNLALQVKTPKEALEIALKFENDSVSFYTEMLKYARSDAKRLVQQIIDEEKEHADEILKFL